MTKINSENYEKNTSQYINDASGSLSRYNKSTDDLYNTVYFGKQPDRVQVSVVADVYERNNEYLRYDVTFYYKDGKSSNTVISVYKDYSSHSFTNYYSGDVIQGISYARLHLKYSIDRSGVGGSITVTPQYYAQGWK